MNSRIKALQKKYNDLVGEADVIRKQYTNTADAMTPEEEQRFDNIMEEAEKVQTSIEREQKAASLQRAAEEPETKMIHGSGDVDQKALAARQSEAFKTWLAWGENRQFNELNSQLKATLQADLDTGGGYLVAPQVFVQQLLKDVDDVAIVRQFATVVPLPSGESLGVPSLDTDLNDADWTVELATGSEDTATAFGKRELRPHPFAKRIKVSRTLIRKALLDPEAHVRERMAYKFGITEEKGFLTGTGANQPLGLFTASASGISTGQDVTAGTTTAITADGLIDVKHTLKPQYWGRARWIMHRDVMKAIRKLKDGNGQYLWQPGLAGGNQPGTIIDLPFTLSEFAPSTFTTGQYMAVLGDLKAYWIADSMKLEIQRVDELYAETNQIGFIGRAECDGMPVWEEAFVRAKLA